LLAYKDKKQEKKEWESDLPPDAGSVRKKDRISRYLWTGGRLRRKERVSQQQKSDEGSGRGKKIREKAVRWIL